MERQRRPKQGLTGTYEITRGLKDSLRVPLNAAGMEDAGDLAFGIDQIGHTDGAHIFAAPQLLLLPHVIGLVRLEVGIGEQGVRELVLRAEFLMALNVLRGDCHDIDAQLLELRREGRNPPVPDFASFGAVLAIELHDDGLAPLVLQLETAATIVAEGEVGCCLADLKHGKVMSGACKCGVSGC